MNNQFEQFVKALGEHNTYYNSLSEEEWNETAEANEQDEIIEDFSRWVGGL